MPNLSIIIPTLNESNRLPLLLSDISETQDFSEVIIIDSMSQDETEKIAILYGARFYKLNKKNRGLQLNFGAKKAKGKWLLFIHADSRLKPNWSQEIKTIIEKESSMIYFFNFRINHKRFEHIFLELLVNLRSKVFKTPYGDQGLLIHKNEFKRNKGYKEIPLMEDFDFVKRIKNKKRLVALNQSLYTSGRKWEKVNFVLQSIKNCKLRKRWEKGESLEAIYNDYYGK